MNDVNYPSSASFDPLSELLRRASSNDERAFAKLHKLTKNKMRKTAYAAGAKPEDIDDILQDAYIKIWRNARKFDPDRASAISWMCTIIRNTAIDKFRVRKLPTSDLGAALAVPWTPDFAKDEFDEVHAASLATKALGDLPESRRQLFALAYIEGESRAKLSQRFGVPVGTIKTWLHRAMQSVREDCLAAVQTVI